MTHIVNIELLKSKYTLNLYTDYKDELSVRFAQRYVKSTNHYMYINYYNGVKGNYNTAKLILKKYMGDEFFYEIFSRGSYTNYITGNLPNWKSRGSAGETTIFIKTETDKLIKDISLDICQMHFDYFTQFLKDIETIILYNTNCYYYFSGQYKNKYFKTKNEKDKTTTFDIVGKKFADAKVEYFLNINWKFNRIKDTVNDILDSISKKLKNLKNLKNLENLKIRNAITSQTKPELKLNNSNIIEIQPLLNKYSNSKKNFKKQELNNDYRSLEAYNQMFNSNKSIITNKNVQEKLKKNIKNTIIIINKHRGDVA